MPGTATADASPDAASSRLRRGYLDHHATTPLDPRVFARMRPLLCQEFGNASSQEHAWGWAAADALERARDAVARFVGATADEIVFTSGATEANNLAILGTAQGDPRRRHLVASAIEHTSVLRPIGRLARAGHPVAIVPCDRDGAVDPGRFAAALRPDTLLASLQAANNEVGTVQDIAAVGAICRQRGVLLHVDAAQAGAWLPLDVQALGIDLLSLSGHKMHGPLGIGALFVRRRHPRIPIEPVLLGGGHEHGLRPGTPNLPAIAGLAEACAIAARERDGDGLRVAVLRDRLWERIRAAHPGAVRNGHPGRHLPNNLHVTLPGFAAERVIRAMPGIAVSTGAACAAARREPSHVLRAMGRDDDAIHASLRFGLGRFTTAAEVDWAGERLAAAMTRLQEQP